MRAAYTPESRALFCRSTRLPAFTPPTLRALMSARILFCSSDPQVEILLPIDAGNAGVRQDLRVSLLDLPIVGERIELMARLRRSVVVGAVARIVIFEEGHGAVLPGQSVASIPDQADAV